MIFAALIGLVLARKLSVRCTAQHRRRGEGGRASTTCAGSSAASCSSRSSSRPRRSCCSFPVSSRATATPSGEAAWYGAVPRGLVVQQRGVRAVQRQPDRVRRRPVHLPAHVRRDHPRRPGVPRHHAAAQGVPPPAALVDEHQARAVGHSRAARRRHRLHHGRSSGTTRRRSAGSTPGVAILAGFFQSVQTRTAGFNSVDIGAHARRDLARHGRADVHRRRPGGHGRRHQGHHVRRAVLHHDDRAARRGRRQHLRQATLARGAPPGDHGRADRRRGRRRRSGAADAPDRREPGPCALRERLRVRHRRAVDRASPPTCRRPLSWCWSY